MEIINVAGNHSDRRGKHRPPGFDPGLRHEINKYIDENCWLYGVDSGVLW